MTPNNTFHVRYFFKLSSNIITILVGVVTAAIVPRALGVNTFGAFSYANNVITQILSFLDMRASTGFYVKLSQRQSESSIITFYSLYTVAVFAVLILIITLLTIPGSRTLLFEDIDTEIIWFSMLFVVAKWISDIFIKISDAYGTTSSIERIKIANQVLAVLVLLILFYTEFISITVFYLHQIAMFSLLSILIYSFFRKRNYATPFLRRLDNTQVRNYSKEFYTYSAPLVVYLIAALVTEVFDRYILQHFGGNYQQGLYGFSFSLANMAILFVTSMTPLFIRELSIAFVNDDTAQARSLYRKYVPTLYVVSGFFCCFLFVFAESIILIFGGEQYNEALLPLQIMLLYPLMSTYSNLNGSVIYAKAGTTFLRNITFFIAPAGMITTYVLIAERFLDLGATGLAIKVLSIEFISTMVMLVYISRHLQLNVAKFLLHMFFAPVILLALAFGIKISLSLLFAFEASDIVMFVVSGIIYSVIFLPLVYFFPAFVGLSKEQIDSIATRLGLSIRRT